MSDSAAELAAGRVGRAHGLDGSFYVTGPVPRLLAIGATVTVDGRRAEIVRRSGTDAHPILRLAGVGDRAAAAALRGMELTVAAARAPQLEEGEWWAHELEECEVFDGDRLIGAVRRLIELPSCEAIEVDSAGGGDPLLVPLVSDAIHRIDVGARRIEVDGDFLDLAERRPSSPRASEARSAAPARTADGSGPRSGEERDGD